MNIFASNKTETCQVHGAHGHKVNWALASMVLASVAMIVWHVWVFGPTVKGEPLTGPFPWVLGREMWDLLVSSHGILAELREVFVYFLAGIVLAGLLRTYKVAVKLQSSLRKYGIMSVFVASFIGIITPLCACGTVTTAISLLFAGLPLAPVMSLMITSSLLSPSTYLVTLNDLGPEWTVIRTIAAYSMGIFAGVITHLLRERGFRTEKVFIEGAITRGDFHDEDYPDERLRCNCRQKLGNRVAIRTGNKFLIFLAKSAEMLWPVGKYIIVGVTMGMIVERYVPTAWLNGLFGRKDPFSIVWITLASVPLFLHQLSASSIIGHIKGSLGGTVDGGAALALMIGGPVTAIPTMVMFWTIFKKRVFFLYMFVCLAGTMLISYAFQYAIFVPGVDTGNALLQGVKSVSGGNSTAIIKEDQLVRIVMDPGGKGLIATYTNDVEGHGGVVFDADVRRFLGRSAGRFDNGRYALNVAKWLEQSNNSAEKSNILVYDIAAGKGSPMALDGRLLAELDRNGFKVTVAGGGDTRLTRSLLDKYSQAWVMFGSGTKAGKLTADEIEALSSFVGTGKGMLVAAGGSGALPDSSPSLNSLSSRFGVRFAGTTDNRDELRATTASYFLLEAGEALGRILKKVHKA